MSQTVLIIEDEQKLRDALSDGLSKKGYQVITAANGKDGLAQALKARPGVIVLDLIMPVMGGEAMLVELRKNEWGETVPVIILSNVSSTSNIASSINEVKAGRPLNDYFVKSNISISELTEIIGQKLN